MTKIVQRSDVGDEELERLGLPKLPDPDYVLSCAMKGFAERYDPIFDPTMMFGVAVDERGNKLVVMVFSYEYEGEVIRATFGHPLPKIEGEGTYDEFTLLAGMFSTVAMANSFLMERMMQYAAMSSPLEPQM